MKNIFAVANKLRNKLSERTAIMQADVETALEVAKATGNINDRVLYVNIKAAFDGQEEKDEK